MADDPASKDPASKDHPLGSPRWLGAPRWIVLILVLVGIGLIVAVIAVSFDWTLWPWFVAAVLVAVAISTSSTVVLNAALRRSARDEAEQLEALILARLPSADPYHNAHQEFVRTRFTKQFARYAWEGPRDGTAFTLLSLGSIVFALASSGLAASATGDSNGAARWLVFAFGLAVAGLTTVNQLWRPAQRSTIRFRAANALRQHGWDFALARGAYADADSEETASDGLSAEPIERVTGRWFGRSRIAEPTPKVQESRKRSREADGPTVNAFVDAISKILRDAEAIDETAPELAPATTSE